MLPDFNVTFVVSMSALDELNKTFDVRLIDLASAEISILERVGPDPAVVSVSCFS